VRLPRSADSVVVLTGDDPATVRVGIASDGVRVGRAEPQSAALLRLPPVASERWTLTVDGADDTVVCIGATDL